MSADVAEVQPHATAGSVPDAGAPHTAFPALDGIRAVAVLLVITTHAAFWTGNYGHGFISSVYARMDSGVALFFVLSGFLLSRPWLVAAAVPATEEPPLRRYLVRRAARILPAYWLAVALCLTLLPQNRTANAADWVRQATLVQIYHVGWLREGLTQTWSLCTEVAFYVLLPLALIPVTRWVRRRGWSPTPLLLGCLCLTLVPPCWAVLLHALPSSPFWDTGTLWLPAFAGWFGAGVAMAVVRTHLDHFRPAAGSRWWWAEDLGRKPGTCWSLAGAAFLLSAAAFPASSIVAGDGPAQSVAKNAVFAVLAAAAVWPTVFGRTPVTTRLLANPVARYVGTVSYGMFLLHILVLDGVMTLLGERLFRGSLGEVLPLTLAGTLLLSAVSFRWVERPVIRRAHVVAKPRPQAGPTAVAPD
jgi:peptidoglycan/LPS O-acetylase OafA/YrhL